MIRVAHAIAVDVLGLAGAGLVGFGCWRIYEPAGIIVVGIFLLSIAFGFAPRRARKGVV